MHTSPQVAAAPKGPVLFVLFTVMLDAVGIGLILPVMPDLIAEVKGADLSQAALWGGILAATFALMQFLFSPTLGNLSDRFGRRPVLLISMGIMALDYFVMALAGTIWWLLIGRIIGGITAATNATAGAFMADISAPEKKAQNFGLISACFGMGFVLGPVIGGFLGELGTRAPFYAAGVITGANFLFGYFVLKETVKPENRRPFEWRRANPLGGLKAIGSLPGVKWLLVVWFLNSLSTIVYPAVWAYYTKAAFEWTPALVGLSLGVYGISMAIVQGGLIRVIIPKVGEHKTVYYGLLFNCIVLSFVGFITNGWIIMALVPMAALGAIVTPALQGVMSQLAQDNQQGELQGVLSSLYAIAMILSQLVMTQIFFAFTKEGSAIFLPGAPFVAAAVAMLFAWIIYAMSRPAGSQER